MTQAARHQIFTAATPTVTRIIPELAKEIGLNESIMLLQLDFWINSSENHQDNCWWTYQSIRDMQEKAFPYWSIATINRTVQSLERKAYIVLGNYNKRKGDNTRWIKLDYKKIGELHSIKVVLVKGSGVSKRDTLFQNETASYQNETPLTQNDTTLPETPTENTAEREAPAPYITAEMIAANEGLRIVTPSKGKPQTSQRTEDPTPQNAAASPLPAKDTEPSLKSRPRDVMAENMRGWQIIELYINAWEEQYRDRTIHKKKWFQDQAAEMASTTPPFTDEEITAATKAGIAAKGASFTFDGLGQALKELRMNRAKRQPRQPEYIPQPSRKPTPEQFREWQAKQAAQEKEAANE